MGRGADVQPPPPPKWESAATLDLTLTRGNSRSFLAIAGVTSKRKSDSNEILLGASAGYGDNTTETSNGQVTTKTQDYLKGFGQWNHLFSQRFYGGLRLEGLHDAIADINYRFTVSPLAGYYFIKETNTFLSAEVGPSYVYEQLGGHTESYVGARVGERFEHKFNSGAKVWETLEWIPQVDKFENWILNAEIGVSAPITKSLETRLVAQDTYNNQPAKGRLKNDLKLMAGIAYRF
jgi:putative salt-induced outer membrane protein YdiY